MGEEGGASDWTKPDPVITSPVSAPPDQWKSREPEMVPGATNIGHEDQEVIIEAPGVLDEAAGGSSEPGPRTWSSLVKSGAGAAPGASKPPAGPKEATPVFQGDRGGHQKPSVSGYARGQRGSSQGRSPGQRSERYSKDTESDTRMSEMVKNGDSQQLFVGNLPHNCTEDDL